MRKLKGKKYSVRGINMKKVKYFILFFLMLLSTLFSGELYQKYLGTYTDQFYYFDISAKIENGEKERALRCLQELSEKNDTPVFVVLKKTESSFSETETIYSTAAASKMLNEKYGIHNGNFKSVFSGSTSVKVEPIENAAKSQNAERCYFLGNFKKVQLIKTLFDNNFGSSHIHQEKAYSQPWLSLCIWSVVGMLLLLLTWLDIQFRKKEIFVLLSLGESRIRVIMQNILVDGAVYILMFVLLYFGMSPFSYLGYRIFDVALIFFSSVILSSLLYFSLYRMNMKQVLYGANINEAVISNGYLIKAALVFITVIVLSGNVLLISSNNEQFMQLKRFDPYNDFHFLTLEKYDLLSCDEDSLAYAENVMKNIYEELYKKNQVVLASTPAICPDWSCSIINQNAAGLLTDELRSQLKDDDYYILLPQSCADKESIARGYLESEFGKLSGAHGKVITYTSKERIPFVKSSESPGSLGFEYVDSPIIIYCNFSPKVLKNIDCSSSTAISSFSDIIFKTEDVSAFEKAYGLESKGYYFSKEKVSERFMHLKGSLTRIVLLNCVVSALMLLLEIFMVSALIKAEYKAHAMELAVKKVLGYSIYQRNKTLFLLNTYSALIGIVTVTVISLMYQYSKWYVVLMTGALLLLFEYVIITLNIIKIEKTEISKILKGGSL